LRRLRASRDTFTHMMNGVTVEALPDTGDTRGGSFSITPGVVSFLGEIRDVHLTTLRPGAIRGNHFHQRRREALLIVHGSGWELHWDQGPGTSTQSRRYPGRGVWLILIHPGCAHALRNCGEQDMLVFGMSSGSYHPDETIPRPLI
jgi:dTDP-4-dehydrorhamnose 3,5-epimerase-like enzyme